ncbi:Retrovirus-related Pol polyprotein from transposon [Tetrabaena socialis]|uniref:Retrovirus-related Pol polyprotein from transposon n=1 Tax=Tetrabaena socialis TaxID=47790 RepID=A0A2J7ZLC8_9CHLO|nr:Retrovirus-related Pol polyprotein from transposon [Tetrabaena socialis]|eukprot:PNH01078.1 Retrovirus-related Pol polyprotein from transposon [Tetrabaena socialis]
MALATLAARPGHPGAARTSARINPRTSAAAPGLPAAQPQPQPASLDTLAYSSNAQPEPAARVPIPADAQPKPVARPPNLANAQSKPAAQAPYLSDAQPRPDAVLLSNASARPKPVASRPNPDPASVTSTAVRLTPATGLPDEIERVTLATGLNSSPDCTSPEGQRAPPAAAHFAKDPSYGYTWCERPDLELELRSRFRELLRDNEGLFARSLKELGCYSGELGPATIDLVHDNPIYESARRHSDLERGIMEAKCIELRDAGIIKPSTSAHYALNHTMPAKKDAEGNWTDSRFCCDARPLNAATKPDMYRPPLPEELFDKVGTATWLSKCDCRAAFNQIPMRAEDQEKTSFHWNGSLWQYTRNLYGLRNATACFQRVMDHHIRKAGLQDCCVVFVDDLLVFSHTAEQHYADLSRVLDMLRDINIKLHPDKTVLVASEVEFLGHLVSARGLRPMEAKVAAIQAICAPSSLTELLSLLGLMNYYRGFLPRYSDLTAPLTLLTKKSVIWNRSTWLPEHQAALDVLKLEFSREGLCLRRLDPSRPIILHTDFLAVGVSGVLGQQDDNGSQYARWALIMQEYNFDVAHRPGALHFNADVLSRSPVPSAWDGTGARLDEDTDPTPPGPRLVAYPGLATHVTHVGDPRALATLLSARRFDLLAATLVTTRGGALPCDAELLAGGNGFATDAVDAPQDNDNIASADAAAQRRCHALGAVRDLSCALRGLHTAPPRRQTYVAQDVNAPVTTISLNTSLVSQHFYDKASSEGLVVLELLGGHASGLEACLHAGWSVRTYIASGMDPTLAPVIQARVNHLRAMYPQQLLARATAHPVSTLDVAALDLAAADAIPLRQLPVAGPPAPPPYFTSAVPGQPIGAFPPGPLAHHVLPLRAGGAPALDSNEVEAVLGLCLNSSFSKATEDVRCAALSLGIAVEPAAVIFTYAHALQRAFITPHHMATLHPVAVPDPALTLGGGLLSSSEPVPEEARAQLAARPVPGDGLEALSLLHDASPYGCTMHIALVTEILDGGTGGPDDVWLDTNTLSYIRSMCAPDGLPRLEVRRVTRRAAGYSQGVGGAGISRIMANGSLRAVPPPAERRQLIESAHARNGHFGRRRTCAILQLAFWWHGMARDVAAVVSECKVCDRANTSGNVRPEALNPLPGLGPFYRWGVDLAGPLPPTARGHRYVMIAIEHFSKHIELVPLLDKTAACVAQAFLQHVLARFSAPAEVLTDQGTEFQGEFGDLLRECFIDHRTTSAGHPQSDGAAERVVQLVKRGLRKYCHERQAPNCWDQDLPWLALGYRCSPQASTLLSPYRLLYGVDPVVPPGVRARWAHPLDLAMPDRDALWALLEQRGQDMRADMLSAVLVASEVEFLGHLVSARGLRPMEAKVAAIQAIRAPSSLTELLSLLGLMNYYRGYLPRYSDLTAPLTLLTKKSVVWNRSTWLPEHQAALDVLKLEFSREGLCLRRLDPSRPIILHTDFSAVGVSGVLGQQDDNGSEYMCACVSRSLNVHERNYISYKGEMLAAGWAMKTLRPYLHGRQFTLVTDHAPLLWLMENRDLTGQYARWALIMQEYNFDVAHRPGALHFNADVLSRSPVPSAWDGTGARLDEDTDPTPPGPRLVAYPGLATHVTHVGDPRALATLLSARRFDLLAATLVTTRGGALPCDAELLAGGNGFATDAVDAPQDNDNIASADAAAQRRCHALGAVRDLSCALRGLHTAPPRRQTYVAQDVNAPVTTISLNTSLVSQHFYDKASSEGLVVLELLGGHASGLEACLHAGWSVRTYIASGMDPTLAPVIQARVNHLRAMYPQQLLARATAHPVSTLDVAALDLAAAGAGDGRQWLVISRADTSAEATVVRDVLGRLQRLQPHLQPAYLIDTPVGHDARLGYHVQHDQARTGSLHHAATNTWTNLCAASHLHRLLSDHRPVARRSLADAIPLRQLPVAGPPAPPPYFTSAVPGQPIGAFPPGPLAHHVLPLRAGGAPALDSNEVEAVLGLCLNSSFSKATEDVRCAALSLGIAVEPAAVIFTYAHALQRAFITPHHMATLHPVAVPDPALTLGGGLLSSSEPVPEEARAQLAARPVPGDGLEALSLLHDASPYGCTMHIALVTEILDGGTGGPDDVWLDTNTLSYIRSMCAPDGLPRLEVRRVTRRAAGYSQGVGGAGISRIMANGSLRAVPPPADRRQLIKSAHARNGHFGSRRTCAILQLAFWWHGMARDVAAVVSECKVCDRANTSGNVRPEALNPLPVLGPFYRWGVDLAGPLPPTARGHRYVMIAIEHFSKHIELVPLLDKTAAYVAQAFLQHVLARFSAPAEVLTDQGTEFQGEFGDLLRECFIDHRTTSAGHPQSDGAAERVVQLVKRGLRKYCHERQAPNCWDQDLPWLALGYRCSPQASTLLSPYRLLYGVDPVVPPGVRARWARPRDLAMPDRDALWALLEQRGQDMRADMLSASGNLAIAQHRDKQRYAQLRSGSYAPRVARFEPGDYVYVLQRNRLNTLQLPPLEQVLRVVGITAEGVATLVGRCGGQRKENVANLAICHLPNLDPQVDPRVAIPDADLACERCGFPDQEDKMLLCDGCGAGWHLYCLQPPLTSVPKGTWVCPTCPEAGVTVAEVAARALRERTPAGGAKFLSAAQRRRLEGHRALDGCLVQRRYQDPLTMVWRVQQGTAHHQASAHPSAEFEVRYDDGRVEPLSYRQLKGCMLEGPDVASGARSALVTLPRTMLPDAWQLDNVNALRGALAELAPGCELSETHLQRLVLRMPGGRSALQVSGLPECVPTEAAEVESLLRCVDLGVGTCVFEPWSGTGGIASTLKRHGMLVVRNDVNSRHPAEFHEDALQPGLYRRAQQAHSYNAIVSSPWFALLDVALPLAVRFSPVVAFHVPGSFVINSPPGRQRFLAALAEAGRLSLVLGLPRGPSGLRCVWLVVFRSLVLRKRVTRQPDGPCAPWVL